jgi:hypothetical protein
LVVLLSWLSAKLCQALAITRDEFDGVDLIGHDRLWVEDDGVHASESEIVATPRINIQYAAEWSEKVPPPPLSTARHCTSQLSPSRCDNQHA